MANNNIELLVQAIIDPKSEERMRQQLQKLGKEFTLGMDIGSGGNTKSGIDKANEKMKKYTKSVKDASMVLKKFKNDMNIKMDNLLSKNGEYMSDEQKSQLVAYRAEVNKLSVDEDNLAQKIDETKMSFKSYESSVKINTRAVKGIEKETKKYEATVGKLNKKLRDMKLNPKMDKTKIEEFSKSIKSINMNNFVKQGKLVNKEMDIYVKRVREANIVNKSLFHSFSGIAGRFMMWAGIATSFYTVIRGLRQGVTTITEIDTAMVELRKVTDETEKTYDSFGETAFEVAKKIGRSTSEYISATADFGRMGFDLAQAQVLAQEALVMMNVGDGIETIDDATAAMIAGLRGFQVEGEQTLVMARKMNDSFNEVANNFAINTGDLAFGVQRTSATLSQAGNSIDQVLGMLAGSNEILQNISKTSTGLITITQRLRGMDEEGEEIIDLIPKLSYAFEDLGISITDSNGQIRNTYEILDELAEVYPTLTENQRAWIAELVSGKRQAPVLQSLMANWEQVTKATETSVDSMGSAMIENEKYLDSIMGKVAKFKAQVESFWGSFIDTDFVKDIVDMGTRFVETMEIVVESTSSARSALGVAIPIAMAKFTNSFIHAYQQTKIMETGMRAATGATVSMAGATVGLTTAMIALNAMAIGIPILIGYIASSQARARRETEELVEALNRQVDISKETSSLINKYKELAENTGRTAEEEENLIEVKQRLIEILPESQSALDNENLSLTEQIGLVEELNDKELELLKIQAQKAISRGKAGYEQDKKDLEQLNNTYQKAIDNIAKYEKILLDGGTLDRFEQVNYDSQLKAIESHREEISRLEQQILAYEKSIDLLQESENDLAQSKKELLTRELALASQNIKSQKQYDGIRKALLDLGWTSGEVSEIIQGNVEGVISRQNILNDAWFENIQTVDKLDDAQKTAYINMLEQSKTLTEAIIEDTKARINALRQEALAMVNITQMSMLDEAQFEGKNRKSMGLLEKELSDSYAMLNNIDSALDKLNNMGSSSAPAPTKPNDTGGGSTAEEYKAIADQYQRINLELERNTVLLNKNKILQDLHVDDMDKRLVLMQEEIDLNKQRQQSLHELNNQRRAEMKELESVLLSEGFTFEGLEDDRVISNLENIKGKSKEVEEQFKRYIEIQSNLLPQASNEWYSLANTIQKTSKTMENSIRDVIRAQLEASKQSKLDRIDSRNEREIERLERAKASAEREISGIESRISRIQQEIDDIQKAEETRAENMEREKRLKEITDLEAKLYYLEEDRYANMTEEQVKIVGLEKERTEYLERQVKLQELQLKLENLKNQKNIQQLTRNDDGSFDFTYVADQDAIEDVNDEIEDLQKEHHNTITDLKDSTLDELQKAQESYDEWERQNRIQRTIEEKQERIQRYENEISDLEEQISQKEARIQESYDRQRQEIEEYYDDVDEMTDERMNLLYEAFDGNLVLLATALSEHISGMKNEWSDFFNDILSEMNELGNMQIDIPTGGFSGGVSGGGSSGSSGAYLGDDGEGTSHRRDNKSDEIERTLTVIENRKNAGLDTSKQNKWLDDLINNRVPGYSNGIEQGLIVQDQLAMLHGDKANWEAVFTKNQLSDLLNTAVTSTMNMVLPKLPSMKTVEGGLEQIFNINKLEFPNVTDSDGLAEAILELPLIAKQYSKR